MLVRVASSTTAAACSTPRTGSPVAVAAATNRSRGRRLGDVAALHHDVGAGRADALDGLLRLRRSAASATSSTIRPQPAAAIFSARNSPRPPRPPVMM